MDEKQFNEIIQKLNEIKEIHTQQSSSGKVYEKWLTNDEMMQLLRVSKSTMKHYRDTGMIAYSQVGNKLYYKLSNVNEMLESNYKNEKV